MELKWFHDFTLFDNATVDKKARFFTQAIGENHRLPLLLKQLGIIIF